MSIALRKSRIIGLSGYDKQSRQALVSIGQWQRALSARVQLVLLREAIKERSYTLDVNRFSAWAQEAQLELEQKDIRTCSTDELELLLRDLLRSSADLLVVPGSRDLSAVVGTLPIHALWRRVVALGGKVLLSCGEPVMRNVLVVSDGSPRTHPVLNAAFDLAAAFDVHLSHLDARLVFPLANQEVRAAQGAGAYTADGQHSYLSALHVVVDTVRRAPRKVRPDLLLVGAPAEDGGATASALACSLLPCSVLLVPL